MATQEFQRTIVEEGRERQYRYVPSAEVRYNGIKGRFWDRFELREGCWVFCWRTFYLLRATRSDIAE